jgi:SEC-C motif
MATPAQCTANAENAQRSTGPKTEEGKAKVAKNGVKYGLFAAYEHLAPADKSRITQFVLELHEGFPEQNPDDEDIIGQYAIAKWRNELCFRMESAFFAATVAEERAKPESAALIEQYGEDILLGKALCHDAAGPNVFSKITRYEARITKELQRASDAFNRLLNMIATEDVRANPISQPKAPPARPSTPETPAQTPRNAPCPCGSGEKFKRCCGEGSPAVLCAA